ISGVYIDTIVNMFGCDSINTLQLTVVNTAATIAQNGFTLHGNAGADSYQWLTCNPFQAIAGETSSSYLVTANGSYALAITQNGCADTSSCVAITNVGMKAEPVEKAVSVAP